jgi:hypothetical protein
MTFYPPDNSMIPDEPQLTLLFRVDEPEQAEALHTFRASFGAATDIEALDENTFVLHIRPGVCACGGGGA